jgi:carbamoyltransferase
MYILGISCYYHDAAAALLHDGVLVAAVEEERLSRKKHDAGFPERAIDFCLRFAGIKGDDLDYVVFYEKPLIKLDRILTTAVATFPRSLRAFREAMASTFNQKLWIKAQLMRKLGVTGKKVLFVDHHLSHAASSFLCSPFHKAAILTVDGVGEWTTATMGEAQADWDGKGSNAIRLNHEIRFPHSLGLLYSAFTSFLGFEVNEGEYKVMGMAPYGRPRYLDKVYKVVSVAEDGSFHLNMDYFQYHYSSRHTFNDKFIELFGSRRDPASEFVTALTQDDITGREAEAERNQYYADVAASIQVATEEIILKMVKHLHKSTGARSLCLAGGVGLNSVANGRILRETPFESLFIQPAAGDSGGAVGAALYTWHVLLGKPRRWTMENAYLGQAYSTGDIHAFLDGQGIKYETYENEERLLDRVVDDLLEGKVIGWFQGRFEWGPRALGNRSILADPRRGDMKQIVNNKIKFREPFRPFAPVVLESHVDSYFEGLPDPRDCYPARYMLLVLPWKNGMGDALPAVNHLGTGRLQTVRKEWNPRYYALVERFGQATGIPVLMNTSFNLRGEPIVSSPANAWSTFNKSGLDTLVMENCLVRKEV